MERFGGTSDPSPVLCLRRWSKATGKLGFSELAEPKLELADSLTPPGKNQGTRVTHRLQRRMSFFPIRE